jgi:hypothetical protein
VSKLICFRLSENAPRLVAARSDRAWMDATRQRYAYRCLPLTIANSMGWELLCPFAVTAAWNGGVELDDIKITSQDSDAVEGFAQSHFGHGVLTFQTQFLFRTEPGMALWVRGTPNQPKDGIAPLDGIVETDWLSFTFTMNWMFTRPGFVKFERDEPFCFITPVAYHALDDVTPEILPIEADPKLKADFEAYGELRGEFNRKLAEGDAETVKVGWQKWYMRGNEPTGRSGNPLHISKLRLNEPRPGSPRLENAEDEG